MSTAEDGLRDKGRHAVNDLQKVLFYRKCKMCGKVSEGIKIKNGLYCFCKVCSFADNGVGLEEFV